MRPNHRGRSVINSVKHVQPAIGLHVTTRYREQEHETMIRCACRSDMLPMIEAALAAHGYHIAVPLQVRSNSEGMMVMARGLTSVVLLERIGRTHTTDFYCLSVVFSPCGAQKQQTKR
jgi:hypothetical protein